MGNEISNEMVVASCTQRIVAMKKHFAASKTSIPVKGRLLKPAAIVATYQKSVDARALVDRKLGEYKAALLARDALENERRQVDDSLRHWVLNWFGPQSAEAGEFGFAPRKLPDVPAHVRERAVRLNKATRDARGTMGKKKRLAIRGTLPEPTEPAPTAEPEAPPPLVPID